VPVGELDAPGGKERPGTVGPGLAVHILVIVRNRVEPDERLACPRCPIAQEAVEHLCPGRIVHLRGLGKDAVEIEQAPANALRKAKHPN
jgi:hypothetical protein